MIEPVDGVDWLADEEAVLAVEIDGEARASPVQIMLWHEIADDEVAGSTSVVTTRRAR